MSTAEAALAFALAVAAATAGVGPVTTPEEPATYPPGASADGIDNATRLMQAHRATLRNASYVERSDWEDVTPTSTANGTFRGLEVQQYTVRTERGSNGTEIRITGPNESSSYWLTDEAVAFNSSSTEYGRPEALYEYSRGPTYLATGVRSLVTFQSAGVAPYLRDLAYEHTGTTTRGNRTLYRYQSTGIVEGVRPNVGSTPVVATTETIDATVVVSDRGVVRSFTASERHAAENETVTVTQRYAVDELGETNTQAPAWLSEKLVRFDASRTANGSVVVLTHLGGASVSDPVVLLHTPDDSIPTRVDGTLEPDDTLYLYLTADEGSNRTLHTSVNERPSVNGSLQMLGEGDLSLTVSRYVFGSYDSGIQLEVTIRESATRPASRDETSSTLPRLISVYR